MARQGRIVVPDTAHHVVARGVDKVRIFRNGFDKGRYLKRAAKIAVEEKVTVHGYCLMNNHVHFLLTPTTPSGLAKFFSRLHTWWVMQFNKKQGRTGHLFQSRYFSSPLSECHFWTALRYVELNSVRAKLVKNPEDWPWSSARDHLGLRAKSPIALASILSRRALNPSEWRAILDAACVEGDEQLRRAQRASRPCGPPEFVRQVEAQRRSSRLPTTIGCHPLQQSAPADSIRLV